MASKTKIYIVLEFVTGGELFDKIVRQAFTTVFVCSLEYNKFQIYATKNQVAELLKFIFIFFPILLISLESG